MLCDINCCLYLEMSYERWQFSSEHEPLKLEYRTSTLLECIYQYEFDFEHARDAYNGFCVFKEEHSVPLQCLQSALGIEQGAFVARPCPYKYDDMYKRYTDIHYRMQGYNAVHMKKPVDQQDPQFDFFRDFRERYVRAPKPERHVHFVSDEERAKQEGEMNEIRRMEERNRCEYERLMKERGGIGHPFWGGKTDDAA